MIWLAMTYIFYYGSVQPTANVTVPGPVVVDTNSTLDLGSAVLMTNISTQTYYGPGIDVCLYKQNDRMACDYRGTGTVRNYMLQLTFEDLMNDVFFRIFGSSLILRAIFVLV